MPVEVWAAILTYLTPIALCNVSVCSKTFYVLAHENKKFEKKFTHSKFIVSNVDMCDKYAGFCLFFIKRLQHMLEKFFYRDLILPFKKKLLSDVILTCCFFVSMIISLIVTGVFMFIIGAIFAQNSWSRRRNCVFF